MARDLAVVTVPLQPTFLIEDAALRLARELRGWVPEEERLAQLRADLIHDIADLLLEFDMEATR